MPQNCSIQSWVWITSFWEWLIIIQQLEMTFYHTLQQGKVFFLFDGPVCSLKAHYSLIWNANLRSICRGVKFTMCMHLRLSVIGTSKYCKNMEEQKKIPYTQWKPGLYFNITLTHVFLLMRGLGHQGDMDHQNGESLFRCSSMNMSPIIHLRFILGFCIIDRMDYLPIDVLWRLSCVYPFYL